MTTSRLTKLCVAAGIAFGVSACNGTEKRSLMNVAAAGVASNDPLYRAWGRGIAESQSPAAAQVGSDIYATAEGTQYEKCKKVTVVENGVKEVGLAGCLLKKPAPATP